MACQEPSPCRATVARRPRRAAAAGVSFFGGDLRGITTKYTTSSFVMGPVAVPLARLGAAVVSLLAVAVLGVFLARTTLGKAIRASANNREGAALVGVNVPRVYLVSFSLGTMAAALAGAVIVPF